VQRSPSSMRTGSNGQSSLRAMAVALGLGLGLRSGQHIRVLPHWSCCPPFPAARGRANSVLVLSTSEQGQLVKLKGAANLRKLLQLLMAGSGCKERTPLHSTCGWGPGHLATASCRAAELAEAARAAGEAHRRAVQQRAGDPDRDPCLSPGSGPQPRPWPGAVAGASRRAHNRRHIARKPPLGALAGIRDAVCHGMMQARAGVVTVG
jgi:hypothetical protein